MGRTATRNFSLMHLRNRVHWENNRSSEMTPDPNSPNGCFSRHGYKVEREPRRSGQGYHRTVLDPHGNQVLQRAGYEAEIQFCRDNNLMT